MSESKDLVLIEKRGAIGLLTINRPKTLNALNVEMLLALEAALTDLERDDAVRAIVLTGAGERVDHQPVPGRDDFVVKARFVALVPRLAQRCHHGLLFLDRILIG
jgi:1,4-dihydroxy-2-naphthoyl-CoA synthase